MPALVTSGVRRHSLESFQIGSYTQIIQRAPYPLCINLMLPTAQDVSYFSVLPRLYILTVTEL
jgi:hypothetical protein